MRNIDKKHRHLPRLTSTTPHSLTSHLTFYSLKPHSLLISCCRLSIRSEGEAAEWQPDKMGSYSVWGSSGGRKVWKHESRQNYLYYWEWGVNTGTEWMVGHSPFSSVRGIRQQLLHDYLSVLLILIFYRSDNLEGLGSRAICFDDAEVVGDWYVHTEDNIWVTDNSLTIQCEASDQ